MSRVQEISPTETSTCFFIEPAWDHLETGLEPNQPEPPKIPAINGQFYRFNLKNFKKLKDYSFSIIWKLKKKKKRGRGHGS